MNAKELADRARTIGSRYTDGARRQLPDPIHLWDDDPDFAPLFEAMSERTLVDRQRSYVLYRSAIQARVLDGQAAEVGVYKGGTALLLRETLSGSGKVLHLFDTFEGMPETDAARDIHRAGDFDDTSLASVRAFVGDGDDVEYHQGLFPSTATVIEPDRFALVHVDADIYSSVRACCEFFYPRLTPGAVLLFDDYGFRSCPGAMEAVDEFFDDAREVPLYLPTGQALVRKL